MPLISVNPMKSTTLGGVETLIRELQNVYGQRGELIELYEHSCSNDEFKPNPSVRYLNYGTRVGRFRVLSKLATKLKQRRLLDEVCVAGKDTIIVLFHPNDLLYMSARVRKQAKIILVQTNRLDVFFGARLERWVLEHRAGDVDIFTVYTDQDKQRFLDDYGQVFAEIKVIPRGCKIDRAQRLPKPSKKIVAIARIFEEQKNFRGMVEIMQLLGADFQLDIYGGGSDDELKALQRLLEGASNVAYKGVSVDVQKTLADYSVFMMTSHFEGFGQSLIEARSQGLPIVAYNSFDALSWVVEHGKTGFIVPPGDAKLFAQKLEQASSPELYAQLSSAALEKAKETDRNVVAALWAELFGSGND
ncbi:glycosyltransferase [Agaribacterium haliotis]|uniref:glycosyltransferase n=1 Tax=Agaribacterium haliotis TaxID=2013869 RepID=UPI0011783BA4|nr:glycosyltransferase [Agaribacterium haliotis]